MDAELINFYKAFYDRGNAQLSIQEFQGSTGHGNSFASLAGGLANRISNPVINVRSHWSRVFNLFKFDHMSKKQRHRQRHTSVTQHAVTCIPA